MAPPMYEPGPFPSAPAWMSSYETPNIYDAMNKKNTAMYNKLALEAKQLQLEQAQKEYGAYQQLGDIFAKEAPADLESAYKTAAQILMQSGAPEAAMKVMADAENMNRRDLDFMLKEARLDNLLNPKARSPKEAKAKEQVLINQQGQQAVISYTSKEDQLRKLADAQSQGFAPYDPNKQTNPFDPVGLTKLAPSGDIVSLEQMLAESMPEPAPSPAPNQAPQSSGEMVKIQNKKTGEVKRVTRAEFEALNNGR